MSKLGKRERAEARRNNMSTATKVACIIFIIIAWASLNIPSILSSIIVVMNY